MKVKDIIKKQTTVIALAVVLVVVAAIGISYAVFFMVKENSDNQVITAGTLRVTVDGISKLTLSNPTTDDVGIVSTPVNYTVKNTDSNLPAAYDIYIYENSDNTMDLSKVKVSIGGSATTGATPVVLNSIADKMVENGTTYYKIKSGTLAAKASGTTEYLRLWIDEDLLPGEVTNVNVSLSLYIVSEVQE